MQQVHSAPASNGLNLSRLRASAILTSSASVRWPSPCHIQPDFVCYRILVNICSHFFSGVCNRVSDLKLLKLVDVNTNLEHSSNVSFRTANVLSHLGTIIILGILVSLFPLTFGVNLPCKFQNLAIMKLLIVKFIFFTSSQYLPHSCGHWNRVLCHMVSDAIMRKMIWLPQAVYAFILK